MEMTVGQYTGYELTIGSVYGVRWFQPDEFGRLRACVYSKAIWKPGENIAECRRGDDAQRNAIYASSTAVYGSSITLGSPGVYYTAPPSPSLAKAALEGGADRDNHSAPHDMCRCGFYAFAENCDDGGYARGGNGYYGFETPPIPGIIECYGRTIIGTKGLRCEKARIVALVTDRADIKALYPDVRYYKPTEKRDILGWKTGGISKAKARMLRAYDLAAAYRPTPETDPKFWTAA